MRAAVTLDRDEINDLGYPVVVEGWKHAVGNYSALSRRMAFHAEFNQAERKKARKIYNIFYTWYIRSGSPDQLIVASSSTDEFVEGHVTEAPEPISGSNKTYVCTPKTFRLMLRLIDFFARR